MARKKDTRTTLGGLSTAQFVQMTKADLQKYSDAELKTILRQVSSAANRRYKSLASKFSEAQVPAMQAVTHGGGKFKYSMSASVEVVKHRDGTETKTEHKARTNMMNEIMRASRFLGNQTATVRGAQKYQRQVAEGYARAIGADRVEIGSDGSLVFEKDIPDEIDSKTGEVVSMTKVRKKYDMNEFWKKFDEITKRKSKDPKQRAQYESEGSPERVRAALIEWMSTGDISWKGMETISQKMYETLEDMKEREDLTEAQEQHIFTPMGGNSEAQRMTIEETMQEYKQFNLWEV